MCFLTDEVANARASATSAFGAVSGSLSGHIDVPTYYAGAAFQAAFSDYLIITGGTGAGSLTALFSVQLSGGPVHPSYSIIVGSVGKSGDELSTTVIPVSSSFTFGVPTRIGGMVMGTMSSPQLLSEEDRDFGSDADLHLVEIRAFDAAGRLGSRSVGTAPRSGCKLLRAGPGPGARAKYLGVLTGGICVLMFGRRFCSRFKPATGSFQFAVLSRAAPLSSSWVVRILQQGPRHPARKHRPSA